MSDLRVTNGHEYGPTSAFLTEVILINSKPSLSLIEWSTQVASIQDGIERINLNVANISALHARTLNLTDSGRDLDATRLDELTAETRNVINNLKERIKALDREPMAADAQMRKNRVRQTYFVVIRLTHLNPIS